MELQLKNIGTIKEANVKLDGLTVIAGENDTGKSTVGKMLFALIKSDNISQMQKASSQNSKHILATRLNLIFDGNISFDGEVTLKNNNQEDITKVRIVDKNFIKTLETNREDRNRFFDATFVQSPVVFDLMDFFNSVSKMKERKKYDFGLDFDVSYPYIMWDLYDKLSKDNPFPHAGRQKEIDDLITSVISGKLSLDSSKFFYLKRIANTNSEIKIEMENTATGIKSFGIIQVLNNNKFFTKKNILILDEPEVHLHPIWQLKMAKLVVLLVEKGMTIIVNSHSPYMIEALKQFSDMNDLGSKTNFYLAKDGCIKQIDNDNSRTLVDIYELLSEPYDFFEEMDSKRLEKFLNG